jgi:hypothetical protein
MDTGFKLLLLLLFVVVYNGSMKLAFDRLAERVEILELWMESKEI